MSNSNDTLICLADQMWASLRHTSSILKQPTRRKPLYPAVQYVRPGETRQIFIFSVSCQQTKGGDLFCRGSNSSATPLLCFPVIRFKAHRGGEGREIICGCNYGLPSPE